MKIIIKKMAWRAEPVVLTCYKSWLLSRAGRESRKSEHSTAAAGQIRSLPDGLESLKMISYLANCGAPLQRVLWWGQGGDNKALWDTTTHTAAQRERDPRSLIRNSLRTCSASQLLVLHIQVQILASGKYTGLRWSLPGYFCSLLLPNASSFQAVRRCPCSHDLSLCCSTFLF